MQFYIDPERESDKYASPDGEAFQLTAEESLCFADEDLVHEHLKDFPLANMNSRDRQRMLDQMVKDGVLSGGWFARVCLPGCLPDSDPIGPFETADEAVSAARGFFGPVY